jgi:Nucleotidyl transferase of unknown function (DUF2204)
VRGKPASGERRLGDALTALHEALTVSRAPWMVIGGIAVIAHGVRRVTSDIDAVVRGDAIAADSLLRILARHGIVSRIDDALAFAQANLILLVRHSPSGVDLDLSFGWTVFEHEAIAASVTANYGGQRVPIARPEDIVIFKAMAGRPRDIDDAAALLDLYPDIDLGRVRVRLSELAAMADAPELLAGLAQLVGIARPAKLAATPAPRPRSARTPRPRNRR